MSNEQAQDPMKPAGDMPGVSAAGPAQPSTINPGAQAASGADATLAPTPEIDQLKKELAEAQAKASEHYDAYVRAHAEMENIRRRGQEDVAKAHKYSIEAFAESLLPVRDSLEMALKTEKMTIDSLRQGVDVTLKQLASVFERNKLLEIDPVGQKFDPNLHQAISMVPGASVKPPVPANHVVSVLQKGYLINDRILRPALVTVAQS